MGDLEEIRKNMKGVKRVVLKITLDLQTGETKIEHSPKKRYDPNVIVAMAMTCSRELLQMLVKKGELTLPVATKKYVV